MRFSKVTNQIKKYLIKYSQLLGREKYIKFLCYCYRDRITCTGNRLPRYISSDVEFDPSASISLGGGITIAAGTIILTHDYSIDYGLIAIAEQDLNHEKKYCKGVSIGNDTFIGQRCIILPGVSIGNNCIIGAGSIVTKNIPDNCVVAGVPAKVLANTDQWIAKRLDKDKNYII